MRLELSFVGGGCVGVCVLYDAVVMDKRYFACHITWAFLRMVHMVLVWGERGRRASAETAARRFGLLPRALVVVYRETE